MRRWLLKIVAIYRKLRNKKVKIFEGGSIPTGNLRISLRTYTDICMSVYFENVNTEEAVRNGDNVDLYASDEPTTPTMFYIFSLSLSLSLFLSHSIVFLHSF